MEEVSQCLKGIVGGAKGVGRGERGCDTGQSWCRSTEWFSKWPVMTGVDACGVHMLLYPHKVLSTICCGQLSWMKMGWNQPLDSSLNPAISNQSLRLFINSILRLPFLLRWFCQHKTSDFSIICISLFSHIPIIFKTKTVILWCYCDAAWSVIIYTGYSLKGKNGDYMCLSSQCLISLQGRRTIIIIKRISTTRGGSKSRNKSTLCCSRMRLPLSTDLGWIKMSSTVFPLGHCSYLQDLLIVRNSSSTDWMKQVRDHDLKLLPVM